jgi:hypothetical protein
MDSRSVKPQGASSTRTRRWILSLVIAAGASALLAVTVWAAGTASPGQSSAQKLAKLHQVDAQATADANSWRAPKVKSSAPMTGPASCPRSSPATGIYYGDTGGFHDYITDYAVSAPTASQPFEYVVFAGAYAANPQQGVLIVTRLNVDPCASNAVGTQIKYYSTPTQQGAVTLTQVAGTEVTYTTAGGGSGGQFDFVSGLFR